MSNFAWWYCAGALYLFVGLIVAVAIWPTLHVEEFAKEMEMSTTRVELIATVAVIVAWWAALFVMVYEWLERKQARKDG